MREELELMDGPGGWVEVNLHHEDLVLTEFFVRLRRRADGEWVPHGAIYVPGLRPDAMRSLPLSRVLLAVGADASLRRDLEARMDHDVAELGTNEFHEQFTGFVHPEPPLRLERPRGRALPDDFYGEVADAYRAATARGLRPRTAIAQAANVSTDVAGRWVREARKRELLPPTSPGRVRA